MDKPLDLFGFSDYRRYLKDWLEQSRKARTSNLSRIAGAIGVHTSFLGHVLSGAKNLSFEQATELSEALNHTELEREYFFSILQIERAGTFKLKKYWEGKRKEILEERNKIKSRVGKHEELSPEDKAIFYSSWLYVAVFVATAISGGQTLEQIAKRFDLTRPKADEILSFLVRTGVCERDGNIFKMGKSVIFLPNDSPLIAKHHTNWRMKAIQKMDSRENEDLFYTSPMSMSKSDFAKVREILSKSIETSLEICRESPADEIFCLNIDFFRSAY